MTFVRGEKDVAYLKERYEVLKQQPLFAGIEYSEDSRVINKWAPLLMQQRRKGEPFAATRVPAGTDVDFGALTQQLFDHLTADGVDLRDESRGAQPEEAEGRHLADQVPQRPSDAPRTRSRRASSSSAPVAGHSSCCRTPASPRSRATASSRSAVSSSRPRTRRSSPSTRRRCTRRPPSVLRRCRCRTSTPGSSTESRR